VRFHLRRADDPSTEVTVAVDASLIRDNEYHLFCFDPVSDSKRVAYYFFVEYVTHESDDALTVRKSSLNSDSMGPHFENHKPSSGTLSFKAFCQKQFRI